MTACHCGVIASPAKQGAAISLFESDLPQQELITWPLRATGPDGAPPCRGRPRQVGDLTLFQNFLRGLAARSGQLLNLTDLARDLGVPVNTAKAWLSVLEATFQVVTLRPYFANVGKRLVKTPKIYFTDVGALCYLAGLRDPDHAAAGPMGGAIFETAVLSEILKTPIYRGEDPRVYFWRTASGTEVDFVVETEQKLIPVEAKLSATPRPAMADGIRRFREDLGDRAAGGYVVHPGDIRIPLGDEILAIPFVGL